MYKQHKNICIYTQNIFSKRIFILMPNSSYKTVLSFFLYTQPQYKRNFQTASKTHKQANNKMAENMHTSQQI